jgi:hypothetical protein
MLSCFYDTRRNVNATRCQDPDFRSCIPRPGLSYYVRESDLDRLKNRSREMPLCYSVRLCPGVCCCHIAAIAAVSESDEVTCSQASQAYDASICAAEFWWRNIGHGTFAYPTQAETRGHIRGIL